MSSYLKESFSNYTDLLKLFSLIMVLHFLSGCLQAQQVYYSEINKKERANLDFQIIGKTNNSILIYKKSEGDHQIAFYDEKMTFIKSIEMDFIPEKTINIDFIKKGDSVIVIYASVKNREVSCYMSILSLSINQFSAPYLIDETEIGFLSDRNLYDVWASDNKNNLLISRKLIRNDEVELKIFVFNSAFILTDNTLFLHAYNPNKDLLSDIIIDNEGMVAFALQTRRRAIDNFDSLVLFVHRKGEKDFSSFPINLEEHFIEKTLLKADNINNKIIFNAYYNTRKRGRVEGLFSAVHSLKNSTLQKAFNVLPASFYSTISSSGSRGEIDNMDPKQILVKRNGEFVLVAEDSYTETFSNNNWNRNFNPAFSGANDFYFNNMNVMGNPNNGVLTQRRYFANNIVVAAVDSALGLNWTNSITKRQMDTDADVYLSFALMNQGKDLQFIYIERDQQKHILSRQSIDFSGNTNRYATVKGNEPLVEFMPRRAKQIAAREIIVPYTYLNHLGFAHLVF